MKTYCVWLNDADMKTAEKIAAKDEEGAAIAFVKRRKFSGIDYVEVMVVSLTDHEKITQLTPLLYRERLLDQSVILAETASMFQLEIKEAIAAIRLLTYSVEAGLFLPF